MNWNRSRRIGLSTFALLALLAAPGCNLLDVNDPTVVNEEHLENATGADLLRREALARLYKAVSPAALYSGLLADEFFYDPSVSDRTTGRISADEQVDRRDGELMMANQPTGQPYRLRHDARIGAAEALEWLKKYRTPALGNAHIGQMFLARGYAILGFAEDYCGGLPLNEIVDGRMVYGHPMPTDSLFARALADFDSAVVNAVDSARIAHAARVSRGRALLGLGRFAEAAEAVKDVPTGYVWNAEFTTAFSQSNSSLYFTARTRSVADLEGGIGLDFASANDPRLKLTPIYDAVDGVRKIYRMDKYSSSAAPIVLASGVEARLIEAEAQLNGDAPGDWLATLNDLRADSDALELYGITDPTELGPLADPGTHDARVDLLFRERAFWLFGTGHRLGDLRRLVRHYGRAPEDVFPSGAYHSGGEYGVATSLPFPAAEEAVHNPAITGCME